MRRYPGLCGLILACVLGTLAQDQQKTANAPNKPNLTGSWELDRGKSNAGKASTPDLPLKITHRDPELRVTHQYDENGKIVGRDFVYYTDGRGETNPANMLLSTSTDINSRALDKRVTSSKTKWNGKKLVTRSILRSSVAGHLLEFEVVDEWKISEDGNTLTETSKTVFRPSDVIFIPADVPDIKRVYRRVPD